MFYYLALLLPCTVCLVWTIQLFCRIKTNTKSQNILTFYVLCASIHSFIIATQINGVTDYGMFYKLAIVDSFIMPLIFPLMYLYFKSLIHCEFFNWKDSIWFIPAIIIGGGTFLLYQVMGETKAANYLHSLMTYRSLTADFDEPLYKLHYLISVKFYFYVSVIGAMGVSVYVVVNLVRYYRHLRDYYSVLYSKPLKLDTVFSCFILSLLLGFALVFLKRQFLEQHQGVAVMFSLGWAIACFGLCYHSSQMISSVTNLAQDLQLKNIKEPIMELYLTSVNAETIHGDNNGEEITYAGRYANLLNSLNKLFEEDKIFLKSNLRADEVARLMATNRAYVSRVIKEVYHCSFSDFINRKRVEYAQELMLVNPEMKQEEIANRSGFINASSLSRTFKQITGIPPKEWLRCNANTP